MHEDYKTCLAGQQITKSIGKSRFRARYPTLSCRMVLILSEYVQDMSCIDSESLKTIRQFILTKIMVFWSRGGGARRLQDVSRGQQIHQIHRWIWYPGARLIVFVHLPLDQKTMIFVRKNYRIVFKLSESMELMS